MKKIIKTIVSMLLIAIMLNGVFAYQGNNIVKGKGFGKNQNGQTYELYDDTQVNHQSQIDSYPVEDLSQEEIDGLMLMREEEKLARDVYLELYDIWGQQIFSNIAASEQTHTDAVKSLLDKYSLNDSVVSDERGVFSNVELQKLYDELVEKGSVSLLDALIVGATIEDLDINDLEESKLISDNQDILIVYNNLEKGSRNHLRSFVKLIESNGGDYELKYISEEYYNSMINSDLETGIKNNNQNSDNLQGNSFQKQIKNQGLISRMRSSFRNWFN